MHVQESESVGHCTLFRLNVVKIRHSFEIGSQMGAVKRSLKTLPTERLCLVLAAQCLHYIEAYLLPFERDPAGPVFVDRVDRLPGFISAVRLQKSPRDFGRHYWHSLGRFALLRDERINVALGICNFLQG